MAAKCYWMNGTPAASDFAPCNPKAEHSACCALKKNNPDICLPSGLCYAQQDEFEGLLYANGCTDSTGQATECPHICPDQTNNWGGGKPAVSWNVLQCNSGTFCCRDHKSTENCCGNSTALIHTRVGKLQIPTGATATVFATATVTSSSQSSNGSVQSSCPKDNTVVVGGAVGGALGAALLASLVAVAVLYRRRADGYKKSTRKELSDSSVDIKDYYGSSVSICQNCTKPAELSAKAPVHELQ